MDHATEEPFKIYNLRYVPLFALYLICGILCVRFSLWIALILGAVALGFSLFLLFSKSIKWGVALALVLVFAFGFGISSWELYARNNVGLTGTHVISCRVTEVKETEDGYVVTADKVKSGKSYSGGVSFYTDKEYEVGQNLSIYGTITIKELSLTTVSGALNYRKGAKYQIDPDDITVEEKTSPPLAYTIKTKVLSVFQSNQGDRAGAFSYAMMFGDAEYMLEEDKTAMRSVGVAHVFAVSGLHIGVLAGAVLFLLKKLKLKDGYCILVVLPLFAFYAFLVGFTPSVLRAAIMVTVGLAASALGERYDDLSALALAAILILLARPLYLFDVSFIMSFLSIFGIQSLARPLEQAFLRKGFAEWLAAGLSLSIATTVALLPVSAIVFGRISLIGFLLNILVVPLASAAYILNLISLLLTLVIPSFGALLSTVGFLPLLIAELSARFASLGLTVNYEFAIAELLVYYAVIAFVGKYSLIKKKVKFIVGGAGAGILAILIFVL